MHKKRQPHKENEEMEPLPILVDVRRTASSPCAFSSLFVVLASLEIFPSTTALLWLLCLRHLLLVRRSCLESRPQSLSRGTPHRCRFVLAAVIELTT